MTEDQQIEATQAVPRETPSVSVGEELDSPEFTPPALAELAARDYKRVNAPRPSEGTAASNYLRLLTQLVDFIRADQDPKFCHCCRDYLSVADSLAHEAGLPEGFPCHRCDGDGQTAGHPCRHCKGTGRLSVDVETVQRSNEATAVLCGETFDGEGGPTCTLPKGHDLHSCGMVFESEANPTLDKALLSRCEFGEDCAYPNLADCAVVGHRKAAYPQPNQAATDRQRATDLVWKLCGARITNHIRDVLQLIAVVREEERANTEKK